MTNDNRDDTMPPGHGFAFSEPFPLDAASRIAALQDKLDAIAAEVMRLRAKCDRRGELLDACRDVLREHGAGHVVARITAEIGDDRRDVDIRQVSIPVADGH